MPLQATVMALVDSTAAAAGLLRRLLRPEELVENARQRTGLDDLGDADVMEPLARFLDVMSRPNGGYGARDYRFADHGLDADVEAEKFRPYMLRFGTARKAYSTRRSHAATPVRNSDHQTDDTARPPNDGPANRKTVRLVFHVG